MNYRIIKIQTVALSIVVFVYVVIHSGYLSDILKIIKKYVLRKTQKWRT